MNVAPRFTSADLETLPDIPNVRYEIVDGELFVSKATHWEHQYVCSELGACLRDWNKRTGSGIAVAAAGVVFADDDDVIPDVVWVSRERLAAVVDSAGHLRAAPELVVEVLSPGPTNERRDREAKFKLYSRQGVREYWIVDWRRRTVQVFRREQAALQLVATLESEDTLTTPLLPGFECPVADLWAPSIGTKGDSDR